jgi:divalent metal cation (Fe/Co/Zn/Cd) transporter
MADREPGDVATDGRDETAAQRADRNWTEILQEFRVTQTGTQVLAGFLLTVAFQSGFSRLHPYQQVVYLVLVILAAATTTVGLVTVSLHRRMFRRRHKPELVRAADIHLKLMLTLLSILTAGVVFFLFDVVTSLAIAVVAGVLVALGMLGGMLLYPLLVVRGPR